MEKNERTVLDCYRELPEAHKIPDTVWTCYNAGKKVAHLKRVLLSAEIELESARCVMLTDLLTDWTREEIDTTGMRDCV